MDTLKCKFKDILDERCFETVKLNTESHTCNDSKSRLFSTLENFVNLEETGVSFVSLSGGVDSMVVLHALMLLPKHTIVAYHLDYGNRHESKREAEFLRQYCEIQGVNITVEKMNVTRDSMPRAKYEKITKQKRFDGYKDIMARYGLDTGVLLGHHMDDVVENIFNNIMKNNHTDDLQILKTSNVIDGVNIVRPFLSFKKDVIFAFAAEYDIPYFKDTTPSWSCRGKMRNNIFPELKNCYGEQFDKNLLKFSESNNDYSMLLKILMAQYTPYDTEHLLEGRNIHLRKCFSKELKEMPLQFWISLLDEMCTKAKLKPFSKKAIKNFYENRLFTRRQTMDKTCKLLLNHDVGSLTIVVSRTN